MTLRELDGAAAPPMSNGELAFEAPWQGRVFAMANALCDAGAFQWHEFQSALIDEIAAHVPAEPAPYAYYERFQAALEALLARKGLIDRSALNARSAAYLQRPHGHDH